MGYCKWCKTKLDKSYKINNNTEVCERCYNSHLEKVCWKCHEPLGMNSVDGKCPKCYQVDYSIRQRKIEEMAMGVNSEIQKMLSSPLEFTDADYNKWMTTNLSGNRITKQVRDSFRKDWLYANLIGKYNWTKESIEANYASIEMILDRNFSKMIGKKMMLVDTKNTSIKIVSCEDRENNIILIDLNELEDTDITE